MPTITLRVTAFTTTPAITSAVNDPMTQPIDNFYAGFTVNEGGTDGGAAIRQTDSQFIDTDLGAAQIYFQFTDDHALDAVTITSVQAHIRHRVTGPGNVIAGVGPSILMMVSSDSFDWTFVDVAVPTASAFATSSSAVMTVNPITGLPWQRADLFRSGEGPVGMWAIYAGVEADTLYDIDSVWLSVESSSAGMWCYNPTSHHYVFAETCPGEPFVASEAPTITITGISPRST